MCEEGGKMREVEGEKTVMGGRKVKGGEGGKESVLDVKSREQR